MLCYQYLALNPAQTKDGYFFCATADSGQNDPTYQFSNKWEVIMAVNSLTIKIQLYREKREKEESEEIVMC